MSKKKMDRTGHIVRIICFLVAIGIEIMFFMSGSDMLWNYSPKTYELSAQDISESAGYTIDGPTFIMDTEDPHFTLESDFFRTENVTITFSNVLESDLNIQIYYASKWGDFSEAKSFVSVLTAGANQYQMDMPGGSYDKIRFDIDGNFELYTVAVSAHTQHISIVKLMINLIILGFVLFLIWKYGTRIPQGYTALSSGIYDKGIKCGMRLERFFFVAAILMGVLFSFLVSPEQVPDESNHYQLIEYEFGMTGYFAEIQNFYAAINSGVIPGNTAEHQSLELMKEHAGDHFSSEGKEYHLPNIFVIRHLPTGLGFYLGVLLHLPILACMQLAELFSVLFYAFVGYHALKLMPFKKELLCGIMLLPVTIQQCSSINYDAVLLPLSFFLVAYLLKCAYGEGKVTWKQLIIVFALTLCIAIIKLPYVLLLLLLLLIPKEKWELKIGKKFEVSTFVFSHKILCAIVCLILAAAAFYVARNSRYVKLLIACAMALPRYLYILVHTLQVNGGFYLRSAFAVFGCLDTYGQASMYWMILLALFLLSQSRVKLTGTKDKISAVDRLVYAVIGVGTIVLVITIMLTWSFFLNGYDQDVSVSVMAGYLQNISVGDGVQGRYFIPVGVILFLPFSGILKISKKELMLLQMVYYPWLFWESAQILLQRFWI